MLRIFGLGRASSRVFALNISYSFKDDTASAIGLSEIRLIVIISKSVRTKSATVPTEASGVHNHESMAR